MTPYEIRWDDLRRGVRIAAEGKGHRQLAAELPGVSASTVYRFLAGQPVDLVSFLALAGYSGMKIDMIIVPGVTQLNLLR